MGILSTDSQKRAKLF